MALGGIKHLSNTKQLRFDIRLVSYPRLRKGQVNRNCKLAKATIMWRRIWAMTQKELIQVFRDRATLMLLLMLPIVQLSLFATAIHTDIKHISMVVADQSMSAESRSYLNTLVHSEYFDIVATVSGEKGLSDAIDSGQASLGILIPPDFATALSQRKAHVLMLVDGSDSYTTNSAMAFCTCSSIASTCFNFCFNSLIFTASITSITVDAF